MAQASCLSHLYKLNAQQLNWGEHFQLNDSTIEPLTNIGQVTARILGFNDQLRLLERQLLIDKKKYPSSVAMRRMKD